MRTMLAIALFCALTLPFLSAPALSEEPREWRKRASEDNTIAASDIEQEIMFGREVAARLIARYRYYDNALLMKYVNLVGKTLAESSIRSEIEFHFAVLETSDINAYAAPGGYIFVTKGALEKMKDESELAGVLAHEIVHVSERHIVKELNIRGTEDSPVAGFARLIGGSSESARIAFSQAVDKALDMLFKDGYKREDETQADRTAVVLCALSGYDPAGLARYLDRIAPLKGKDVEVLDRTHPPFAARLEVLRQAMTDEGLVSGDFSGQKERFSGVMKKIK